ncbi:MAG TPA: hypothetical protein VFE65_26425 [Pseudonocardia sp.]|jgi:hypothetical protein|nr:hypothetical protein [Pseudonocardia sp.]
MSMEYVHRGVRVHSAGRDGQPWMPDEALETGARGRSTEDGDMRTVANQIRDLAVEQERCRMRNEEIEEFIRTAHR